MQLSQLSYIPTDKVSLAMNIWGKKMFFSKVRAFTRGKVTLTNNIFYRVHKNDRNASNIT